MHVGIAKTFHILPYHLNMQAEIQFAVYNLTDNTGTHIALFIIIKKNVDTLGATRA